MTTRLVLGKLLVVLAVPLLVVGLIDPLEGGLALLAAVVLYAVVGLLLQQWPPRYLWIWFVATLVVGMVTLALAIGLNPPGSGPDPATAMNPLQGSLRIGLVIYRALDLVVLVQAVRYAVNVVRR